MNSQTNQGDSKVIGKWANLFSLPTVAIHTHLLPNGKVMFWGRRGRPGDSLDIHQTSAYVLDLDTLASSPTSQPTDVHGRQINLFCSGHNLLPDGQLFVAGGHYYDAVGLSQACIYDHEQDTWQAIDPMNEGRWYPTCVELNSGTMLTFSGSFALEILLNGTPQVWTGSSWSNLTKFENCPPPLYPRMHLMRDGNVFMSGPLAKSFVLDTKTPGSWKQVALRNAGNRDYAPSVEYRPGKIVFIGGGNDKEALHQPTNIVEAIDLNDPNPKWELKSPMKRRRRQHNATLLPDGTVLVTGGTQGGGGPQKGFNDLRPGQPVHSAEIWDPDLDTWTELASELMDRCYHSINLLLPDGRVLSAGGGEYRPNELIDTIFQRENDPKDSHRDAQIYSPPYLYKGDRPKIENCPVSVQPDQVFAIECSQSKQIKAIRLIKLGSVTHSFNQSQGLIELEITTSTDAAITTKGPQSGSFSPGHYMLFLLNEQKIPSIAKIVMVGEEKQLVKAHITASNNQRLLIKSMTPLPIEPKAVGDQVEAKVGLTPTCPYGLAACWGAAFEALTSLSGNPIVGELPDKKSCTATLLLHEQELSNTYDWPEEFQKIANGSYDYRGIELNLFGTASTEGTDIYLQLRDGQKLLLKPIEAVHNIQWDITANKPVDLLPNEKLAFANLERELSVSPGKKVRIIGPLLGQQIQPILEVRSYQFEAIVT